MHNNDNDNDNDNDDDVAEKRTIAMILRQTNYSIEEARTKLAENDNDAVKVIRQFLGLQEDAKQRDNVSKQEIQKEIFKQFRQKLHIDPDKIAETLNRTSSA